MSSKYMNDNYFILCGIQYTGYRIQVSQYKALLATCTWDQTKTNTPIVSISQLHILLPDDKQTASYTVDLHSYAKRQPQPLPTGSETTLHENYLYTH